ncbi:flavodoxin domain-containing protein [Streptomyces sp. E11-3]|uniref:flavodoxin domain-containing protein n=1 Tax=Streptomyces sp. E11-3 TaxID=3110112 RepID=UPI0039816D79
MSDPMRILVGYASVHGSTQSIAEHLAVKLAEHGHTAAAVALSPVQRASDYDAFVLGSAIHHGAWLPQATDFIRRHPSMLSTHPAWLFSVGQPPAAGRWPGRRRVEPVQMPGFRSLIHPWGHKFLAGALYRDHLPLWRHLAFKARRGQYGSHRDWKVLDTWAEQIDRELSAEPRPAR